MRAGLARESSLEVFRILAGGLLSIRAIQSLHELPELIGSGRMLDAETVRGFGVARAHALLLASAGPEVQFVLLGAGTALAVSIALGIAARPCAALLLTLLAGYSAVLVPVAGVDDWVQGAVALWLVLLPVGGAWRVLPRGGPKPSAVPAPGAATAAFMAHVIVAYVLSAFWVAEPPVTSAKLAFGFGCVAACYLVPCLPVRCCGLILAALVHLHAYRTLGLAFSNAALWAAGLVFCAVPRSPSFRRFTSADLAALSYSLVLAIHAAAGALGKNDASVASGRLLLDWGLLPPPSAPPLTGHALLIGTGTGQPQPLSLRRFGSRAAALTAVLEPLGPWPELREESAQAVLAQHCAERADATGRLWLSTGGRLHRLAWFHCGERIRIVFHGSSA